MIVRKHDGVLTQVSPSSSWVFMLPAGRLNFELIGVFTPDGRSTIPYEAASVVDGVVLIQFGLDEPAGIARYAYDTEQDGDTTTVVGDGGTINVTVTQYNNPRQ